MLLSFYSANGGNQHTPKLRTWTDQGIEEGFVDAVRFPEQGQPVMGLMFPGFEMKSRDPWAN